MKLFNSNTTKIFCISLQRNGTTSVGQFFNDHGFKVGNQRISRKNAWTKKWFNGHYESIFNSNDFKSSQVYEDDPWWCGDFYKYLFHRFPKSKFILLERDADDWFNSMRNHSNNKTLGSTLIHCHLYDRLDELHDRIGTDWDQGLASFNGLDLDESHREHYKRIYKLRNQSVKSFFAFHDNSRLFNDDLYNLDLWKNMSAFFKIKSFEDGYSVHKNKSK